MSGLRYVYAVCRPFGATLSAQLTGVAGVPPMQLAHHGLVAVVGHVPEEDFAERPLGPIWRTWTGSARPRGPTRT